eukprot:186383-Chlamydomonas_euryale.AAC.1
MGGGARCVDSDASPSLLPTHNHPHPPTPTHTHPHPPTPPSSGYAVTRSVFIPATIAITTPPFSPPPHTHTPSFPTCDFSCPKPPTPLRLCSFASTSLLLLP